MPLQHAPHWPGKRPYGYFHRLGVQLRTIPVWFPAISAADGRAERKKGTAQNLGKREMQKKRGTGKRVKFVDAWVWDQLNAN